MPSPRVVLAIVLMSLPACDEARVSPDAGTDAGGAGDGEVSDAAADDAMDDVASAIDAALDAAVEAGMDARLERPDAGDAGTDARGADASSGPVSCDRFCGEVAALYCEARLRCCLPEDAGMLLPRDGGRPFDGGRLFDGGRPFDGGCPLDGDCPLDGGAATCVEQATRDCNSQYGAILCDPVTGYGPIVARMELERARTFGASCSTELSDWAVSRNGLLGILRGTRGMDRTCAENLDDAPGLLSCVEGLTCHLSSWIPFVTRCGALVREGAACRIDQECVEGLWCDSNVILPGTCVARRGVGAACDRWGQCGSLVCEAGSCVERTQNSVYCVNLFGSSVAGSTP